MKRELVVGEGELYLTALNLRIIESYVIKAERNLRSFRV